VIGLINILECVDIINNPVQPYEGFRKYLDTGGLKVNQIKNVRDFDFNTKPSRANLNVETGDIILARMKGTIKVTIISQAESEFIVSTGFIVLRPKKEVIDTSLLYYILLSDSFQREKDEMCTGATQKAINNRNFKKLKIHNLPFEQQKYIADILTATDTCMQKTKTLIEKYDVLSKGLFFKMFNHKQALAGNWNKASFKELVNNKKGAMRTGPFGSDLLHSEFVSDGIPVLGIDNAVLNKFQWKERRFITAEKYQKLKRYTIFPKDVIVTIMGTVGRVAVIPENIGTAINTKHLAAITLNREVANPDFIAFSLLNDQYIRYQIKSQGKGAIMDGLNLTIIKELNLFLPPIELQNLFAERFQAIEDQKTQAQTSLAQERDLFNSLLQRALKGKLSN
jgi:type I restriction enzyme S subunit